MIALCILCSCAWVLGLAATLIFLFADCRLPAWSVALLLVTAILSFGSCAAEDRVCELAAGCGGAE